MIREFLESSVLDIVKRAIFYATLVKLIAIIGSIAASGLIQMEEVLHSKLAAIKPKSLISDGFELLCSNTTVKTSDSDYVDYSDESHEGAVIQSAPSDSNNRISLSASNDSPMSDDSNLESMHVVAVVIDDCEMDRRRLVHSLLLRNCDCVPFSHFSEKAATFLVRRHFDVLFISASCLSKDNVGFSNLRELRAMTDALFVGIVSPGSYDKRYEAFDLQLMRPLNDSAITVVLNVEASVRQRILLPDEALQAQTPHAMKEKAIASTSTTSTASAMKPVEGTRTTSVSITSDSIVSRDRKDSHSSSSSSSSSSYTKRLKPYQFVAPTTLDQLAEKENHHEQHQHHSVKSNLNNKEQKKSSVFEKLFTCVCSHER